ncbi:hypothetical protein F6R98_01715 [Candidatus Methylospira mobilis]|uniref:Uncharacterized protein n=1 Tax=Candidatus Methylospira mobilis TaxID=1808979 RepID=A0A5Q0BH93_9GAMM|nr:hypothetical protein [Candidatus Methylospira mobilis]QFY41498.1 hypothetical protein F6R98_01715 [Candidatus Methylospira mobilis]WNV05273.1 hypothetical protein RP726_02400 [Candidatus Methylospira mobilis]
MKTRGIKNAIGRLHGARKLGSATLLVQAEAEAEHILTQARSWLERTPAPPEGEEDERYAPVELAVQELEKALAAPVPELQRS